MLLFPCIIDNRFTTLNKEVRALCWFGVMKGEKKSVALTGIRTLDRSARSLVTVEIT